MDENINIYSACSARLLSSIANIRLQLLFSTQFSENECLNWGNSLKEELTNSKDDLGAGSAIEISLLMPSFILNNLKFNTVTSSIINFTSTVEFFIKDIIHLCLQRNSSLRKNAFARFEIKALILEHYGNVNDIKLKLFESLASEHSKGGLFSNKIKKASSFLSIGSSFYDKELFKSLDSIWHIRNLIAHNPASIDRLVFEYRDNEFKFYRSASKDEYLKCVTQLVTFYNLSCEFLQKWDEKAMLLWKADEFIKQE
jgi:hypothetical protein